MDMKRGYLDGASLPSPPLGTLTDECSVSINTEAAVLTGQFNTAVNSDVAGDPLEAMVTVTSGRRIPTEPLHGIPVVVHFIHASPMTTVDVLTIIEVHLTERSGKAGWTLAGGLVPGVDAEAVVQTGGGCSTLKGRETLRRYLEILCLDYCQPQTFLLVVAFQY